MSPLNILEIIMLARFLIFEAFFETYGDRQGRRSSSTGATHWFPGVIFGGDLDPMPINLDFNKLADQAARRPL